ncbi:MAG: cupin domain-containing protein, partial [Chloroflexota bacterium]|nr:cupin domain-containing protein [Chloroflexota bacterium]
MSSTIEVFRADAPPGLVPHGEIIEAAYIRGNMGGLVVVRLHAGELAEHAHEQEHVGVVLEGSFEFVSGEAAIPLQAGDLYRIPPHVPHGVRCHDYA